MDIETIESSLVNGQIKQAKKQVREYGVKKFIIDMLSFHDFSDTSFQMVERYKKMIRLIE